MSRHRNANSSPRRRPDRSASPTIVLGSAAKTRTHEFGKALDLSAELTDGATFQGPNGLRQALERYSPQFVNNLTENLFVYALGRSVDYRDMPQIRAIVRSASATNYRMSRSSWGSSRARRSR